jgi:hypothetical protein
MELELEQLSLLEEMSAALLPPTDISILLNIPADKRNLFVEICKSHKHTDIYSAYQRGRLKTKLELRKTIVKLAKAGSPAAEPIAQKFIREQNMDD